MIGVTLYNYSGKSNVFSKTLQNGVDVVGAFKYGVDVLTPCVILRGDYADYNYAYIAEFKRFYFVDKVRHTEQNSVELYLTVDVLQSFKDYIADCSGTVTSRENANPYISNRSNVYDIRPLFERVNFSENTPFKLSGDIIMVTLKGNI